MVESVKKLPLIKVAFKVKVTISDSLVFHLAPSDTELQLKNDSTERLENRFSRWQNRSATRRKLKTWAYLRLRLARRCVNLALLALALVGIKYARKSTQVFHRLATEPKSTQVE